MKFAFSTLGCPDWPIEKIVSEADRLGYDGVEVRGIRRTFDLSDAPEFSHENVRKTRKLFEDAGVPVVSIDASSSFCSPDEEAQRAAFSEAVRHIAIAGEMGAPQVRVFGGDIPEGEPREKWARILADNLKRLGEKAAEKRVRVAVETHDDWCRADQLMPVIEAVNMENVRPLWDIAHPFSHGETIEESLERFRGAVVHCHVKDHTADHTHVLLGEGIVPIADAVAALKREGFDGYISLEWEKAWMPDIEEPEVAFPRAIEYLRKVDAET